MRTSALLLCPVLAFLSGCLPTKSEQVTCTTQDECGAGFRCDPGRHVCVCDGTTTDRLAPPSTDVLGGVQAIATGYAAAYEAGADVTAVMAGDSQMDPADLMFLVEPVLAGRADYAKGNRFAWPGVYRVMPLSRAVGNVILSHLTRVASGYWHVFDSQCGYTAVGRRALAIILSGEVFPRYGYPNDLNITQV